MRSLDAEWRVTLAGLALALVGWWVHATLVATLGAVVAVTAALLWVWQRECLTGVTYRRRLGQHRASFGEEIHLDVEIVNDKLLPLTWLHIEDAVPPALRITGGTVMPRISDRQHLLHHLLPLLPYQRVRRHLTVSCDQRGVHRFGPAVIRSGNPVGRRQRQVTATEVDTLLVYPKVFALEPRGMASRVPLGDHRSSLRLLGDPSRVMGVREYQAGDPLRHVDWRASARSDSLLVRIFEPTTSLRVAVFADFRVPRLLFGQVVPGEVEFAVSVTASVISDLAARRVAVGLYSTGTVGGNDIARPATSATSGLAGMLELLARASPYGPSLFSELLVRHGTGLHAGTSVVVIAPDFPEHTLTAIAELRRRLPVTAVWVATDKGSPPPPELVDTTWEVSYGDDWKGRTTLELAS